MHQDQGIHVRICIKSKHSSHQAPQHRLYSLRIQSFNHTHKHTHGPTQNQAQLTPSPTPSSLLPTIQSFIHTHKHTQREQPNPSATHTQPCAIILTPYTFCLSFTHTHDIHTHRTTQSKRNSHPAPRHHLHLLHLLS